MARGEKKNNLLKAFFVPILKKAGSVFHEITITTLKICYLRLYDTYLKNFFKFAYVRKSQVHYNVLERLYHMISGEHFNLECLTSTFIVTP